MILIAVYDGWSLSMPEEAKHTTPAGTSNIALHTTANVTSARLPGPRVSSGFWARNLFALGRLAVTSPGLQKRPEPELRRLVIIIVIIRRNNLSNSEHKYICIRDTLVPIVKLACFVTIKYEDKHRKRQKEFPVIRFDSSLLFVTFTQGVRRIIVVTSNVLRMLARF